MELSNYSGEHSLELENNYKALKSKLDSAIRESGKAPDNRMAKDILIMAQGAFKEFKLKKEDREEQYQRLQDAFEKLNKKITEERSAFERESISNYSELKMQVEEAIYQAGKATDSREAKSYLIAAQNAFKGLKMAKEQREELYNKLQLAFTEINARQQAEIQNLAAESQLNFFSFKPRLESIIAAMDQESDRRLIKDKLIDFQAELRDTKMTKEHKDLLYQMIQQAFDTLNNVRKQEDELFRLEAESSFASYAERVAQLKEQVSQVSNFKEVREQLKQLQSDLRESRLLYEQKDHLYADLQEAFSILNQRQDEDRKTFDTEAKVNFERLKKMVNHGLKQAQESSEYKETREYLKKIQSEFKGIRMVKEEREELYARLQTAFETLNIRLDTYFREKQKNWEVRMTFKLKDLTVTAEDLNTEIERLEESLDELENQLEIVLQKPLEVSARIGLEARIQTNRRAIEAMKIEKAETETEIESLQQRLYGDENS
ncbi:MAG: hypothetical protein WCO63_09715 [Bacteroidota bacterium]